MKNSFVLGRNASGKRGKENVERKTENVERKTENGERKTKKGERIRKLKGKSADEGCHVSIRMNFISGAKSVSAYVKLCISLQKVYPCIGTFNLSLLVFLLKN